MYKTIGLLFTSYIYEKILQNTTYINVQDYIIKFSHDITSRLKCAWNIWEEEVNKNSFTYTFSNKVIYFWTTTMHVSGLISKKLSYHPKTLLNLKLYTKISAKIGEY